MNPLHFAAPLDIAIFLLNSCLKLVGTPGAYKVVLNAFLYCVMNSQAAPSCRSTPLHWIFLYNRRNLHCSTVINIEKLGFISQLNCSWMNFWCSNEKYKISLLHFAAPLDLEGKFAYISSANKNCWSLKLFSIVFFSYSMQSFFENVKKCKPAPFCRSTWFIGGKSMHWICKGFHRN